ncbi:hypothetical protein GCM10010363_00180 [Streptomyces omiyaensis]|uniref:hypothetical protein n=1 Tax=Streptomyces omiyaensis TaxID=68247 RepID=UPI0016769634|nr:hypothetical protein [Streptomyces omiyaensis]GGY24058.1 hypothetical protein GCM10010363_00180 [Streptomyces omiyaensis]
MTPLPEGVTDGGEVAQAALDGIKDTRHGMHVIVAGGGLAITMASPAARRFSA